MDLHLPCPLRPSRFLPLALLVAMAACAHDRARATLPRVHAPEAAAAIVEELQAAAKVGDGPFVVEGRMTHFAAGHRARAFLQLLLQRPESWRLTVRSPQGPPLFVLASDGNVLTSLDVGASRFRELPATEAGLQALAPTIHFSLTPKDLLGLLLGEVNVPADAAICANDAAVQATWNRGGAVWQADFTRADGRLRRLEGRGTASAPLSATHQRGSSQAGPRVVAELLHGGPQGLPKRLTLWAPAGTDAAGNKCAAQSLEIELLQASPQAQLGSRAFVVRP